MKDIQIFGAGGHSQAVIELINSLGEYRPCLVYSDELKDGFVLGVPIADYTTNKIANMPSCIAIGDNRVRKVVFQEIEGSFPSFLHNSVVKYPSVKIGKGTVVQPNVVLDADVQIGDFCIINNQATVSHNARVGHFCHISINVALAGEVSIGEGTLVGAGSVILPGVTVGKWATIGAGAVITKNVPDYAVIYGNPAKIVRYNTNINEL